ncbi:major capsid and protease fusion protein [Arthrobacter phage Whytu]|uniref:Major capsid and protease fusion protein n=1 Tax=Arthrobacter phage Whytu TaxID=2713260 RepID=A0A6G8R2Q8_9CAUD|nr:major capsid and protease fusion protein [Arthrobacter phage Whytu]QIN94472.1 major capsid and protease fusion protein [Arthrobacter phage Whytu]
MTIQVVGDLLTANDDTLTASYTLLTFGEPGRTNKGTITVDPGVLTIPSGALPVNDEHDPAVSVGYMLAAEAPERITTDVHFYRTPAGEAAYKAAKAGEKRGISMEVLAPVIRAGKLLAGRLTGSGTVKKPAFPSSLLTAAEDTGDVSPELQTALDDLAAAAAAVTAAVTNPPADPADPPADPNTDNPTTDKVTASMSNPPAPPLLAGNTGSGNTAGPDMSFAALATALAGGKKSPELLAAFATVTEANVFDVATPPTYVGEITAQSTYKRRYADLVTNNPLTGSKVQGWRFVPGKTPVVRAYAGDLQEIPSNEVVLEEVSFDAGRFAGGNKVDRKHYDFPTPGFWAGYLRESTGDYDKQIDLLVRDTLLGTTNEILAGAAIAGVAEGWSKLVDGALAVWDFGTPDWALVGVDLYREMALTSEKDRLAFLNASLGLDEAAAAGFRIRPVSGPGTEGTVTVGTKGGVELQELPGLIRVSAVDVSHAGVDEGVYGYGGVFTRDARAIRKVVDTLTPAP